MKRTAPFFATTLLFTATALFGQATAPQQPADKDPTTRARTATKTDADVTYGRVKEFTAGQKIVIDVDNAPDKEFDMTDKSVTVKVAKGLKVGDPVKVAEVESMGKTKAVTISKHKESGTAHGDKDPNAKKP